MFWRFMSMLLMFAVVSFPLWASRFPRLLTAPTRADFLLLTLLVMVCICQLQALLEKKP